MPERSRCRTAPIVPTASSYWQPAIAYESHTRTTGASSGERSFTPVQLKYSQNETLQAVTLRPGFQSDTKPQSSVNPSIPNAAPTRKVGFATKKKPSSPHARKAAALIVPGVWCGTFGVRTGCDRGNRATVCWEPRAPGPLRLRVMRPPVGCAGGSRRPESLCAVQVPAMERCREARVRATRAAVSEASPSSRCNQSRTDHTATKSNRTLCRCPLPEMWNALRELVRIAHARLSPMIVGATDHAASSSAQGWVSANSGRFATSLDLRHG